MSWGLELDLGVKGVSEGNVVLDVGGRETAVDLTGNRLSNYTVTVEPLQSLYRVLSTSPRHSHAAVFEGRTCEGLHRVGMTAFTAVGRAGYALFHRAEKIDGGRTYAVVWPSERSVQIPPDWEYEPLEARGEFSAALISVPKFLSQAGKDWIKANLQLTAGNSVQNIVQVWPPISNRITSQSIQSVRDNDIVVALEETDVHQATSIFVRCEGDERAAGGTPGVRTFFRYEPGGKPTARFLTPSGSGAMLDVEFSLPVTKPWHALNTAVVLGVTSNENVSMPTPLHSRRATQVLLDIRSGYAKLDYISMPRAARGLVRVGWGDDAVEYCIRASNKTVAMQKHRFEPSEEEVAIFVQAVRKLDSDVVVDFGAFGYVSLPAVLQRGGVTDTAELPRQVRALLKSYLFQFNSTLVWPRPNVRMSDSELVRLFRRGRWTIGDAATRRYLERELARYLDKATA